MSDDKKRSIEVPCPLHGHKGGVRVTVEPVGECGETAFEAPDFEEQASSSFGWSRSYANNFDSVFNKN